MKTRGIVGAKEGPDGNISHVLIEGNTRHTPIERAIEMTKDGKIHGVNVSSTADGNEYLRSNPDNKTANNLDEMAKQK